MANVKKKPIRKKTRQQPKAATTKPRRVAAAKPVKVADVVPVRTGAWRQLKQSFVTLGRHWQFFAVFLIVYAVLNLVLAHNLVSGVNATKSNLDSLLGNNAWASVGTYTLLLTSSTAGNSSSSGAFQYILFVVGSLAVIWALRQFTAEEPKRPSVRESFYSGMAPLVPFVLVMLALTLELLPFAGAGTLYGIVISNGVAAGAIEKILWLVIFVVGAAITLWLLARSLFALYIVTLPGSRPVQSLKDSFRISRSFQPAIIRKLLLLVGVILVVGAVLIVPVIAFAPPLTSAVLFIFSTLLVPLVHTYCYGMYRECLYE